MSKRGKASSGGALVPLNGERGMVVRMKFDINCGKKGEKKKLVGRKRRRGGSELFLIKEDLKEGGEKNSWGVRGKH